MKRSLLLLLALLFLLGCSRDNSTLTNLNLIRDSPAPATEYMLGSSYPIVGQGLIVI